MFLKLFILLTLTGISLGAETTTSEVKPNIILIMTDDVGIEAFKSYGGEDYKTPHLNKLAKEGMQFNHCYSQPLCTPSRVRIMTGVSNVFNYLDFSLLDPKAKTIGHLMQQAGYKTGICGKWQLHGAKHYKKTAGMGMHPSKAGFDTYCLWQIKELGKRYQDPLIEQDGEILKGEGKYGPDIFSNFALQFIRENKGQPFFLYYPMVLVHDPFVPTPDSKNPTERNKKKNFSDMMEYMDKIVGKIIAEVHSQQLENNTLILFTSDNGTHSSITSKWNSSKRRGGKGKTNAAGTHVPLIAYWPGKIKPNSTSDTLVCFSDFMPTLSEIAGTKSPKQVDGVSLVPAMNGAKIQRSSIYTYYNPRPTKDRYPPISYVRNQQFKLYSDGRFYDCSQDPLEKNELKKGHAAIRKQLQDQLDTMPKEGTNLINFPEK